MQGKRIVVTGAGRGIGRACAIDLAARGASVVVNDACAGAAHGTARAIVAAGGDALAWPADISDEAAASGLIDTCAGAFGGIDGLVNNAARFALSPLIEQDTAGMAAILSVNVMGAMFCARRAAQIMRGEGGGAIVNVVSGSALGYADLGAYAASKGALTALTYTWALELDDAHIRVNAVSPRAFTGMSRIQADYRTGRGQPVTYSGRADLPPALTAPAVAYLLSDRAAGITGQILRIDGETMGLLHQPELVVPEAAPSEWTLEAIAAAFEGALGRNLSPVGIAALRKRRCQG